MRLDEWQKFIEAQFLDDDEEPAPSKPAPAAPLPAAPIAPRSLFDELEEPAAGSAITPPEPETAPALTIPPPPDIWGLEAEMPVFEDFLTATRPQETPEETVAPPPALTLSAEEAEETPEAGEPEDEDDAIGVPETRPARRAPKRRVRTQRPQPPQPVLTLEEMWTIAPRHVRTLLEMERREEVAQASYLRPFAEKRRELIERILDPVLTLEDTARFLNVCPATVRRYTNRGILNCYRKEPEIPAQHVADPNRERRQRRFRLSDVIAFLEAQQETLEADQKADAPKLIAEARKTQG